MKNLFRLRITFLCLILLAVLAESTVTTKAWTWWIDDLGDCSASYIAIANDIEYDYTHNNINSTQRDNLHRQNGQQLTSCITPINVPSQEPDFCDQARAARDMCVSQFYGLGMEYTEGRMQCIMESGINQCE